MPDPIATAAPAWMKWLLRAAAAFNLSWAIYMVCLPRLPFEMAQLPAPNYPSLWQSLGMVIGIFGIGYALAASDPLRHWRLVLLGLIGKIGGPLGFVWAASRGEFPWAAGLAVLANDVGWWVPLGLIVVRGRQQEK